MKKLISVLLASFLLAFSTALMGQASDGLVIENLKVDNLSEPVGIDSENPLFSWNLSDPNTRTQKQTAYRITAALSEKDLADGKYVWDSGKVNSDETANIAYAGDALASSTRYFWCVEVYDKDGKAVKSDVSWFETGLMDEGWSDAKWIAKTDALLDGYYDITSFTIEYDFKILKNTASFIFGAQGTGDFYMWQVSNSTNVGGGTYFRPHKRTGGGWSNYKNTTIENGKTFGVNDFVHTKIEVENGTIKTYFNGTLFDTHTREAFELGYIGFRQPGDEQMLFDNIVVKDADGKTLYSEDFSDGVADGFTGITVTNGCADLSGSTGLDVVLRYGETINESSPMFRKEFTTDAGKTVANARLYFTSAGIYRAFINGEKVTDSYLNPGMTAYDDHIMYQTYDVTDLVANGNNAIGVYLGHGWWDRALRNFGTRLHIYGKLLVEYTDGTSDVIVTDESWKFYRFGPILDDDIFNGFKFDGTVEEALEGWNKPGFDDNKWETVKVSAANEIVSNKKTPVIIAQNIPLIKNTITLDALSVTEPKEGVYVYDFGQNIAGVVRITAKAPRGTTIKLRHAEVLNRENMTGADGDPGTIFTGNLPRADATDTYVFKGDENGETFEPFFTYHGFRYLEITGIDEPLPLKDVKALLIMSDLEQTSSFESSNALVNRLYLNSLWSARDNFLSVPTDCPQRGERFGWTGDAQIFARTGSYMMDVNAFYQKYCMDMRDTSTNNRIIADVSPASVGNGWYGQGNRKGATNGWGDAIVIIPYQMYKQYGNKQILEENYETMCNWMDYLVSTSTDYIRDQSWTGDWLPVNEPKTPIAVTDTAFCAYSAMLLSEIAEILGKTEDAATYTELYNNYRNAWRESFLMEDGCTTKCGTQTSYVLGLKFGLFDEDEVAGASKNLVKNIKSWDWHLSTGFLGLSYLNPVLSDNGYTGAAYKLLEQDKYPSWLYSVTTGSTSIWESWYVMRVYEDGSSTINAESHNHFSYGAVSEWMFRYVLGIERDDENSVAFKHFLLKPEFGGSFTYANGSYDSIRGTIQSGWTLDKETGVFTYSAVVPANTTATLYLPVKSEETAVTESGVLAENSEGVSLLGYEDGHMVYELASGSYSFETEVNPGMNDVSSVKVTNSQKIDADITINSEEFSSFPAFSIIAEAEYDIDVTCNENGYVFSHFADDKGNVYGKDAVLSGDLNLDMIFAYTGTDDGEADAKTVTITGEDGVTIKVNGKNEALPYSGTFTKGELVEIVVDVDILTKEFSDLGGIKGVGNKIYLMPYSDITASVNIKDERYRQGYDIFFDFKENISLWKGSNAAVSYEPDYMRFAAVQKTDGSYDPRTYYDFTENTTTPTGGEYVPADKYESIVIGFVADEVAADSYPYLYISTEAAPSYINPVRGKKAGSAITTDMADGKTLREVEFTVAGWSPWTGNIKQIYIDILDNVGGNLRVDYIKFKHRDVRLTVKTGIADEGTVYEYIPGSIADLTELETDEGFLGYSLVPGSEEYITSVEMTDDTVVYANYEDIYKKSVIWDFDDNTLQNWVGENSESITVDGGIVKVAYKTSNPDAYFYTRGINKPASSYKYVVARLRHNVPEGCTGTKPFEVFFRRTGDAWAQDLSVSTTLLSASDDYKTYVIDMSKSMYWNSTIDYIRIDPFEAKSTADMQYYYELDFVMLAEEANLVLSAGYEGGTSKTVGVPAGLDINPADYYIPERAGYKFLGYTNGITDEIVTSVNINTDTELVAKWETSNFIWDFDDGSLGGWSVVNSTDKGITDGVWKIAFSTANADAWIRNDSLSLPVSSYRYAVIDLRHNIPAGSFGSKPFEVFFIRKGDTPWQQHLSANIPQQASDGSTFVKYVVDLKKCSYWNGGTLERLRIDPFEIKSTATTEYYFEIDKISLCYEVKLTLDNGAGTSTYTLPSGVSAELSQYTKPTKEGYVFMGWSTEKDGDVIDTVCLEKDTTLYAVWSKTGAALALSCEKVTVTVKDSAILVVISADTDGRLLDSVVKPVSESKEIALSELALDTDGAAFVKAFLFDADKGLSPLCPSKTIEY